MPGGSLPTAPARGADAKVRVTFLSRQEFDKLDLDTHEKMTENVGTYR